MRYAGLFAVYIHTYIYVHIYVYTAGCNLTSWCMINPSIGEATRTVLILVDSNSSRPLEELF